MPSETEPPHRRYGSTDEAVPVKPRQSARKPPGPSNDAGVSGFLEVEAKVSASGKVPRRYVQYLLYVLAALAAFGAVELGSGVKSAAVHGLFHGRLSVEASTKVRLSVQHRPRCPGNGGPRTALGCAGNQPVPSETEPPHRRYGSTDEAVSNLSAWPRQACRLRGGISWTSLDRRALQQRQTLRKLG